MDTEQITKIYKITNLINNYIYVGSTNKSLEERFKEHCKPSTWEHKGNENSLFYKDIQKYGIKNFKIELLDTCFERHRYIIEEYWWNKLYDEHFLMYDIKRGNTLSLNTKQRIAKLRIERNKEIYNNEQFKTKVSKATSGELNGMYGKKDENALNGRMVVAYLDDNHKQMYKQFPSVKMALQFLGVKGHSKLNQSCRDNSLYRGYYWQKEWIDR